MDVVSSLGEKRPGLMARTNQVAHLAIYGLPVTDTDYRRLAVSEADRSNAIHFPNEKWAVCTAPQPSRNVALRADPLIPMDPDATYDREWGRDIVSLALAAAKASRVDPSEWRMMKEDGAADTTLARLDFAVYDLPRRDVRRHPNVSCR